MSNPLLTKGVARTLAAGQLVSRLEISTFVKNEKQFSLYIQALTEFYSRSDEDLTSYFRIAGIHGMPYDEWNGSPRDGQNGYCVHGTILFPTWHRPYMALFEQEIQQLALKYAKQYKTDSDQWMNAAVNLRQPFWDWAKDETFMPPPEVISQEKVQIVTPEGPKGVPNPFLSYQFNQGSNSTFPPPFGRWNKTLRHPTSQKPNAVSDLNAWKRQMLASKDQILYASQRIFSIDNWDDFSHQGAGSDGSANSLEAVHGMIHGLVGQGGQMSYVPVAAFDPMFWLHHCQVDRLISLWYDIHQIWVPEPDNSQTSLTPFWNTADEYWPSSTITNSDVSFNYTYPEFIGTQSEQLIAEAAGLSGSNVSGADQFSASALTSNVVDAPPDAAVSSSRGIVVGSSNVAVPPSVAATPLTITEWTARIRCKQYELNGSFSVYIFLGKVPADSAHWYLDPGFVGLYHAFVNNSPEGCSNCQTNVDHVIEGYVHLNSAILKLSPVKSLNSDDVKPYLTENIHWGVRKANGEVAHLPSLEVVILATPLTLPESAKFPVVGTPDHHHDVTFGRTGGSRHAFV